MNRPFLTIKSRSIWDMYSRIKLKTLIIHGTEIDDEGRASHIVSRMARTGRNATVIEIDGECMAHTLLCNHKQVDAIDRFIRHI